MKSKRAKEFINNSSELIDGLEWMVDASTARRAVDLAEQDAEEEVTRYRKELEESKKREELACKVIDDQRKEIKQMKARAVEAFCQQCGWYEVDGNCSINDNKCPIGCEYANPFIQKLNEK